MPRVKLHLHGGDGALKMQGNMPAPLQLRREIAALRHGAGRIRPRAADCPIPQNRGQPQVRLRGGA